jgi:hypothetical protein
MCSCGRVRVLHWCVSSVGSRARRWAAGVTWNETGDGDGRWGGRKLHTSVVDAAGAIYVIGGYNGSTDCADVWATTDGGARAGRGRGGAGRCVLVGYFGGTTGVLPGVLPDPAALLRVAQRCTLSYRRGTGVLVGHSRAYWRGTRGVSRGT